MRYEDKILCLAHLRVTVGQGSIHACVEAFGMMNRQEREDLLSRAKYAKVVASDNINPEDPEDFLSGIETE